MNISESGVRLIQGFESCRLSAYQDSVGVWTIGWGHIAEVSEGMSCTQPEADEWFMTEIAHTVAGVNDSVRTAVNQNHFDALCSFAYNLGVHALQESTLLRLLNQNQFTAAAEQFLLWDHAGGRQVAGLTRRRHAERAMFLEAPPAQENCAA